MALEDRLNSFPEAWKPKPTDSLVGEVVGLDERESNFDNGPYPIVTVLTEDGKELAFHAYHTVARRELGSQRPKIGDKIGVRYFGKDEDKGYEKYRIIVEHAEPQAGTEPDWEQIQADADAELNRAPSDPENWA